MDVARFSLAAAVVNDRLYALGGVDGACPSSPCDVQSARHRRDLQPAGHRLRGIRAGVDAAPVDGDAAWQPGCGASSTARFTRSADTPSVATAVASMEFYDPSTNVWSARASMSGPRSEMAAAVINNIIYVVGGDSAAGGDPSTPLTTVEAYDATTDTWTTKAPMLTARRFPAAAAVNGTLYVIGGDGTGSVEAYNPATDTWTMKASMPNGGGSHRAVALNGLIYAVGGSPVQREGLQPRAGFVGDAARRRCRQ